MTPSVLGKVAGRTAFSPLTGESAGEIDIQPPMTLGKVLPKSLTIPAIQLPIGFLQMLHRVRETRIQGLLNDTGMGTLLQSKGHVHGLIRTQQGLNVIHGCSTSEYQHQRLE
jgi:hypothetical protein